MNDQSQQTEQIFAKQDNKPHQQSSFLYILSVFLAAATLSIVFLGYQNYQLHKQLTALQSNQRPPATNTAVQEVAVDNSARGGTAADGEWLTYTNAKCQYQLNYPKNWILFPENETGQTGAAIIQSNDTSKTNPSSSLKLQIGCGQKKAEETNDEVATRIGTQDDGYGSPIVRKITGSTFGKYQGYELELEPKTGDPVLMDLIFSNKDNSFISVGVTPTDSDLLPIVNQILSTIKFL